MPSSRGAVSAWRSPRSSRRCARSAWGTRRSTCCCPRRELPDVRPMGEGRHARFTVSTGGARKRAVAFGVGGVVAVGRAYREDGESARHDVVARLEVNRWEGSVEPRLVVRSMHELPEEREGAAGCAGSCSRCSCGMAGGGWLDAVWRERERLATPQRARDCSRRAARTIVDHGEGRWARSRTCSARTARSWSYAQICRAAGPSSTARCRRCVSAGPAPVSLHCTARARRHSRRTVSWRCPSPTMPGSSATPGRPPGSRTSSCSILLHSRPHTKRLSDGLAGHRFLPSPRLGEAEVDFALAAHEHEHGVAPGA